MKGRRIFFALMIILLRKGWVDRLNLIIQSFNRNENLGNIFKGMSVKDFSRVNEYSKARFICEKKCSYSLFHIFRSSQKLCIGG